MKKDKDIIVWDQFDKIKNDESNHETLPTFTRNYKVEEVSLWQRIKNKMKELKSILIAIFSAMVIGSVLGFIMLNLMTNFNNQQNNHNDHAVSGQTSVKNKQNPSDQEDNKTSTLNPMSGQVLQVGAFNKKENADDWVKKYKQAGFLTTLWERDEQYFLFAGIAATKNDANILASEIKANNFDVFIKEWQTNEIKIKLTNTEYDWLKSFQELWNKSLHSLGNNNGINLDSWNELIERESMEGSQVEQFKEELGHWIDNDLLDDGEITEQKFLLEIWKQFEKTYDP